MAYEQRRQTVLQNIAEANQLRIQLALNCSKNITDIMQQLIQISTNQSISPVEQSQLISEIMNAESEETVLEILNIEHQIINVGLQKTYFHDGTNWIPENSILELNVDLSESSSGSSGDVEYNGSGEELFLTDGIEY